MRLHDGIKEGRSFAHVFDDNPIIAPHGVLEIGCSNGWRLEAIREKYGCDCLGIDPADSQFPYIFKGTADSLPYPDNQFDLVIYGFCLYL